MTVWVGAVQITIQGQPTLVEFLHTIPGLDTNNPTTACVEQEYAEHSVKRRLSIMTPVSLVLTKLHALRHFNQETRQDELHLKVSIQAFRRFIMELVEAREVRLALWNWRRLVECHRTKPNRRLEKEHRFKILDAIPISEMRQESENPKQSMEAREKLKNFCRLHWPRVFKERIGSVK